MQTWRGAGGCDCCWLWNPARSLVCGVLDTCRERFARAVRISLCHAHPVRRRSTRMHIPYSLLDAPTALAAPCGFGLRHKYILYLYADTASALCGSSGFWTRPIASSAPRSPGCAICVPRMGARALDIWYSRVRAGPRVPCCVICLMHPLF